MDISAIKGNSIRLKGKQVTFVVDPSKQIPKTASDAIILFGANNDIDISRVTDFRIIIDGPGEYEVGKVKITGTKTPKGTLYRFSIDNMNIILGSATDTKTEGFSICEIAIINTANDFSESFITDLEPKMVILYGEKKVELAKALGVENVTPVSKITVTKDKLPEKMEAIVLG